MRKRTVLGLGRLGASAPQYNPAQSTLAPAGRLRFAEDELKVVGSASAST